jgi:hypothetical protein
MKERKNSKPKPLSQLIAPEFDISAVTSNARQTFNRQQEQMEPLTLREEQLQEARVRFLRTSNPSSSKMQSFFFLSSIFSALSKS